MWILYTCIQYTLYKFWSIHKIEWKRHVLHASFRYIREQTSTKRIKLKNEKR